MPMTQAERDSEDAKTLQTSLSSHPKQLRKTKVDEGVLINGVLVATDTTARVNVIGAASLGVGTIWKNSDGTWEDLTAEQVKNLATVIGNHVRKCFVAENAVSLMNLTTLADIETEFQKAYDAA